jgi:signal transduction histidine kinase
MFELKGEEMQSKHSEQHQTANHSSAVLTLGAFTLFVTTVVIIFVAEAIIMMLFYFLKLPPDFSTGIVDATLLSLFVAPALYFTLLKPMRDSFLRHDQSEESQRRLEKVNRMKSDFISVAVHELRTPITTIMGYSEMFQNDLNPTQRDVALKVIFKKSEILERLVEDLEFVNQIEEEQNLLVIQTQKDLQHTVNHVCAIYRQKYPEMPIHLNSPEGPLPFNYDEVRISQVIDNLLSNAVKYSKGFQDSIEVSVTDAKDQITICVKDKGVGMTQDEVENIYNMFFRAETKKNVVGGLGLGMAIVKNIIQGHNGTIEVESQRNVGTVVTVSLPKRIELVDCRTFSP